MNRLCTLLIQNKEQKWDMDKLSLRSVSCFFFLPSSSVCVYIDIDMIYITPILIGYRIWQNVVSPKKRDGKGWSWNNETLSVSRLVWRFGGIIPRERKGIW